MSRSTRQTATVAVLAVIAAGWAARRLGKVPPGLA